MEKSNGLKRTDTWNNIYEVLARLDLKENKDDCLDRPSAATEIEQLFLKLLPINDVSKSVVCGNCDGWGYTVDENGRRKEHCKECE